MLRLCAILVRSFRRCAIGAGCREELALSFDLGKSGRFSPFSQFLREKQFVRSLTAPELARVRAEIRQVSCSECGAPIDLEHESQCPYCHAPISFLDPDVVGNALKMWSGADHRSHLAPSPEAVSAALLRSGAYAPAVAVALGRGLVACAVT